MRMPRALLLALSCPLAALPLGAWAQNMDQDRPPTREPAPASAPAPQTTPAAPSDADALAGPGVGAAAERAQRPTLIRHDFNGRFVRLDVPSEEAAIRALPLSKEQAGAAERVLREHAAQIDAVIKDNFDLLLRLQGIREEGLSGGRGEALRELVTKLPMLRDREPLRSRLREALGAEHAPEFTRLLSEYDEASIRARMETPNARGEKPQRVGAVITDRLEAGGIEIRLSYERIIAQGQEQLENALKLVNATPEQEAKLRQLTLDFAQKTLNNPTPRQRAEFFGAVMRELTPEQRRTLWREYVK